MIAIPVQSPFPWRPLLHYLSSRLIPGFESIEDNCYRRQHHGKTVIVNYDDSQKALLVEMDAKTHQAEGTHQTGDVQHRVEHLFYPHLPTTQIYRHLTPRLAAAKDLRGFRPPGCWDAFELCLRTIIGQQVSVPAAQTIMQRLVDRCGELTPQAILAANLDKMGMPGRRVDSLRFLAQAIIEGELDLRWPWPRLDPELAALPGIGPWTRGYLAIRLGREMDAFPETDVGLIRAAGAENAKELLKLAEPWRPYRAYAAVCLWNQS